MNVAIDVIGVLGGVCVSAGAFVQFGMGYALMTAGGLLVCLSLRMAHLYGVANAADE